MSMNTTMAENVLPLEGRPSLTPGVATVDATEKGVLRGLKVHSATVGFELFKRLLDITLAGVLLLILWPVMLACALWIRLMSPGPVLYRQWRVGRDGWLFRIYKFRTMSLDAERHGVQLASARDPRVVPGCRWMRQSHLDELPQLINILLGQMSLVGPRPERPEVLQELSQCLPDMELRLAGTPGLTGLAQLRNGYTNDLAGMRRKLAYDLLYLQHRSIAGDLKLLLQTIPRLWDRSAC